MLCQGEVIRFKRHKLPEPEVLRESSTRQVNFGKTLVLEHNMGFGEGETCEYCGGKIVEKFATLHRKVHGNYVLLEDVPAGVCTKCGTHYYAANVLKTTEATIHGRLQADLEILVAVYSLSTTRQSAIHAH